MVVFPNKKIITFIVLLCSLFFSIPSVCALQDYYIKNYDVDINVGVDNVLNITETIDVFFNEDRHGIYRSIPIKNKIIRNDGSKDKNIAIIKDIRVNNKFTKEHDSGNLILKIGAATETIRGDNRYIISYNYDLGKDHNKKYDELYYNIIGNEWTTNIDKVSFSIHMPAEFDKSKIGFSVGQEGMTGYDDNKLYYQVYGQTIQGKYYGRLNAYKGLTIRLELPEGYFIAKDRLSGISDRISIFSLICLMIGIALWYIVGREKKGIETVEFYPPKNLNSLEVGLLYKGYVDKKAYPALLIDLASRGYLKIEENEKRKLFRTKKTYKIIRLKEYKGTNPYEQYFMEQLFFWGHEENNKKIITEKELKHSHHITMDEDDYKKINKRQDLFVKNNTWCKIIIMIIIFIIIMYTLFAPLFYYYGFVNFHILSLPEVFMYNNQIKYAYLISLIVVIILKTIHKHIPKRTKHGDELYYQIKGFKTFLETAEKNKIDLLVSKNPSYFYDILPYAYVLGVSDKWIKKFDSFNIKYPKWYSSIDKFDNSFDRIGDMIPSRMNRIYNSTFVNTHSKYYRYSLTSHLSDYSGSSSGGGGFSGGGSSGGGSGGGGGGSW